MLTEALALVAKPRDKDHKLTDAKGLLLDVGKGGGKSWRYRYRFGGREKLLVLGPFPGVSLTDARARRDKARAELHERRDPGLIFKADKLRRADANALTFEKVAREWHENQKSRWAAVHASDVINSMERDLFPKIGMVPIGDVDEPLVLGCSRRSRSAARSRLLIGFASGSSGSSSMRGHSGGYRIIRRTWERR